MADVWAVHELPEWEWMRWNILPRSLFPIVSSSSHLLSVPDKNHSTAANIPNIKYAI